MPQSLCHDQYHKASWLPKSSARPCESWEAWDKLMQCSTLNSCTSAAGEVVHTLFHGSEISVSQKLGTDGFSQWYFFSIRSTASRLRLYSSVKLNRLSDLLNLITHDSETFLRISGLPKDQYTHRSTEHKSCLQERAQSPWDEQLSLEIPILC